MSHTYYFTSPTIYNRDTRIELYIFTALYPLIPLHSPTILVSAFVPEFSSLRQIGPSLHYQRR